MRSEGTVELGLCVCLLLRSDKGAEGGISRIFTKRGSIESYSSADYSAAHESALFLTDRELYNFEFRAPFDTAHA